MKKIVAIWAVVVAGMVFALSSIAQAAEPAKPAVAAPAKEVKAPAKSEAKTPPAKEVKAAK